MLSTSKRVIAVSANSDLSHSFMRLAVQSSQISTNPRARDSTLAIDQAVRAIEECSAGGCAGVGAGVGLCLSAQTSIEHGLILHHSRRFGHLSR